MKQVRFFMLLAMIVVGVSATSAQSLDWIQSLMEQGRYREAAEKLRPLADGGNAEAQYMAARLFFEGKGVTANESQGIKYATLSANQSNEKAMLLLYEHYKQKGSYAKAFETAKKYVNQHPYLKKGMVGLALAECYLEGRGTEKNESLAWSMIEQNDNFGTVIENKANAGRYWNFKMTQAGKSCLEDYADYLYGKGEYTNYSKLVSYIETHVYNSSAQQLKQKAESGNGWAMAKLAKVYDEQGYENTAKSWAQKAVNAGSAYGRAVMAKYNYVPVTYSNISAETSPTYTKIEKVTQEWDRTILHMKFTNYQGHEGINTNPKACITCNGRTYKLLHSTLPLAPENRRMVHNETVYYKMVFEGIPKNATSFNLTEGSWKWTGVRFSR